MTYPETPASEPRPGAPLDSFYTPVFDLIVQQQGNTAANVYGVIWRFCQMHDHVCRASLRTLAGSLGLNESTVLRHVKKLVAEGYLDDMTPKLRHRPHVYRMNEQGPGVKYYNRPDTAKPEKHG